MQSTKTSSYRRSSMPTSIGTGRKGSHTGASTGGQTSKAAVTTSTPSSSSSTATATTASSNPPTTTTQNKQSSGADDSKSSLVLAPVSQAPRQPRRHSRPDGPLKDTVLPPDPDQYNPDGSLRTMHRMPGFDQSYAQAMQARYIRRREKADDEKELTINQIFGNKK